MRRSHRDQTRHDELAMSQGPRPRDAVLDQCPPDAATPRPRCHGQHPELALVRPGGHLAVARARRAVRHGAEDATVVDGDPQLRVGGSAGRIAQMIGIALGVLEETVDGVRLDHQIADGGVLIGLREPDLERRRHTPVVLRG
jgi:hypothetical protein